MNEPCIYDTHMPYNYDLEERAYVFAKRVRRFVPQMPKTVSNFEDIKQLIRSSGSIGANYIEANEAMSKKDFIVRIRIAKKEAKETIYWLRLIDSGQSESLEKERLLLIQESKELMLILGSILQKSI